MPMAKVLATDGLDPECVEILLEKGYHVDLIHFERDELSVSYTHLTLPTKRIV